MENALLIALGFVLLILPGIIMVVVVVLVRGTLPVTCPPGIGNIPGGQVIGMAQTLEDQHTQVRLGCRKPRSKAERSREISFAETIDDYMKWGNAKGGRAHLPWSDDYAKLRRRQLGWWKNKLLLRTLGDLEDILVPVEQASLELQRVGDSGKTINDKTSSLRAFCTWCVKRELLDKHPLAALERFSSSPKVQRRAASFEELNRLLVVAPPDRRLLYETAFISGLRRNELAQLEPAHVDLENEALRLDSNWTKNRKPGRQSVHRSLLEHLLAFSNAGFPDRLYQAAYSRSQSTAPHRRAASYTCLPKPPRSSTEIWRKRELRRRRRSASWTSRPYEPPT
jgi:hypothetical protein